MLLIMDIIRGIRNIRGEMNIVPSQKVEAIISVRDAELASIVEEGIKHIKKLANVSEIKIFVNLPEKPGKAATSVAAGAEIYVPLEGVIDFDVELSRLNKEITDICKELERVDKKLSNENFLNKAPGEVVEKEKNKKDEMEEKKRILENRLRLLRGE